MKPKISVIVPIYNTEKYLDKCLTSIINQTMQEIEIICVDDCSPDDSYLIVEKFMAQNSRVSLIRHEKSKGSGGARNTGILAAKADFLASVDSDDYIKPEMMQTLWDASEGGKFDIVSCGYDNFDEKQNKVHRNKLRSKVIQNPDSTDIFFLMNVMFWNKLWRKTLFIDNKIFFPEELYHQDLATTSRIIAKSSNIKIIKDSLYYYVIRPDSVMTTYKDKHVEDTFKVLEILQDFLKENGISVSKSGFPEFIDEVVYAHSKRVLSSDMKEYEINQYLRNMLIGKNKFTGRNTDIKKIGQKQLLRLIRNKSLKLRVLQILYWPFLNSKQYTKLQNHPRSFFKDSQSKFTLKIGYLLNYTTNS